MQNAQIQIYTNIEEEKLSDILICIIGDKMDIKYFCNINISSVRNVNLSKYNKNSK